MKENIVYDAALDLTREICPMTYVKTRLALDRLASGQILMVRVRGDDARQGVPASALRQGHIVLSNETDRDGVTTLRLCRR